MNKTRLLSPEEQARRAQVENEPMQPAVVPAIIPGDADGLLDATQIRASIAVQIPQWGSNPSTNNELLWLRWAFAHDPENVFELQTLVVPPGTAFPLELNIPRDAYLQGRLLLTYEVENWQSNPMFSEPLAILVDTLPPYDEGYPKVLELAVDTITDAWLEQNNDVVMATLPDYPDRADGDTAYFFWVKEVPEHPDDVPPALAPIDVNQSREIAITREVLERVGNGKCYALYALVDKAGNISRLSYYVVASVALGDLPENLEPPRVLSAEDGVLDRMDAYQGVFVQIPAFDNPMNGDLIYVWWGDTPLPPYPLGPTPAFPLSIPVPWATLKANYDFADTEGNQPLTVSYQVARVPLIFPDEPLAIEIVVNLKVAGPENPDEPAPVNPELAPLVVRGQSGLDNQLTPDDAGQDATAHITLYDNVIAGDRIWVYWQGERVSEPYVVEDGQAPGDEVEVAIPWALIEQSGNDPQLPVHYRISDEAGINFQESPPTSVAVRVVVISFPPPGFPDGAMENGELFLNCSSIRKVGEEHGMFVHVPPDGKYLKAGVEVVMVWRVTEYLGDDTVAVAELTETIPLSVQQEVNGIDWFVHPYAEHILPAYSDTTSQYGQAHVQYKVMVAGEEAWSDPGQAIIALLLGGGGSCPLP